MKRAELGFEQLEAIAAEIVGGTPPSKVDHFALHFKMDYAEVAVSKERPRSGGGTSRHYTPSKTLNYERSVAAEARSLMAAQKLAPFDRSVIAHLVIYELIPQSWGSVVKVLASQGLLSPERKDLDNQEKAIFDALNGVVYDDDKRIMQKFSTKRYSLNRVGFVLTISPCNLTMQDALRIEKMVHSIEKANKAAR